MMTISKEKNIFSIYSEAYTEEKIFQHIAEGFYFIATHSRNKVEPSRHSTLSAAIEKDNFEDILLEFIELILDGYNKGFLTKGVECILFKNRGGLLKKNKLQYRLHRTAITKKCELYVEMILHPKTITHGLSKAKFETTVKFRMV